MRPLAFLLAALLLGACTSAARPGAAPPSPTAAPSGVAPSTVPTTAPSPPAVTIAPSLAPSAPPSASPSATPLPSADPDVPPVAAADPAGLADQIVTAEQALRADGADVADLAGAGHLQQVAYQQLATNIEWLDEVLAVTPPELQPAVHANTGANLELGALSAGSRPATSLPSWRIVDPAPAGELVGHYQEAEAAFGVPWEYLATIHLVETRMGRIRGTSSAGAQGPMQFIPETWARFGQGDINDNRDAILSAARYLTSRGAPQDMPRALFAYNNSNRYVRAVSYYADQIAADERAYRGYYHWQVYYRTASGRILLPVGYDGST